MITDNARPHYSTLRNVIPNLFLQRFFSLNAIPPPLEIEIDIFVVTATLVIYTDLLYLSRVHETNMIFDFYMSYPYLRPVPTVPPFFVTFYTKAVTLSMSQSRD